jgi:hypothetical protein
MINEPKAASSLLHKDLSDIGSARDGMPYAGHFGNRLNSYDI